MDIEAAYRAIPSISSPLKRQLMTVALASRLLEERQRPAPVIIGGCALAYYSREVYFSHDIDLAYTDRSALDAVLKELHFRAEGRYWINDKLGVAVEAPASSLAGEEAPREEVLLGEDLRCWVIGLEDLIVNRLNAYKHWNSQVDGEMVELLLARYGADLDWAYLRRRCAEPGNDTLPDLDRLREGSPNVEA
jgi:hypothetical protein